ncbi:MAG: PAS domain-containing protein, partial [Planctomycetota bacterium]
MVIALILALLGTIAAYFNVQIPHTDVFVEGRWTFGLLAAALVARWWLVAALALVLCVVGPHNVSIDIALTGNLMFTIPFVLMVRLVYVHLLSRLRHPVLVGTGWFVLVLFGYQVFNTPLVFGYLAHLSGNSFVSGMVKGWRQQPFLLESVLVAMISALCLVAWRIHAQLQRSEHYVPTTLQSIGDAVIVTDTEARIRALNPVAERLTGWTLADARGRALTEVFRIVSGATRQPVANPVEGALRTGDTVALANDTVLIARDGSERQIADSAAPIRDTAGTVIGAVLVFRDVTAEYQM